MNPDLLSQQVEVELPLVKSASEIEAYAENGVLEVEVQDLYRYAKALHYQNKETSSPPSRSRDRKRIPFRDLE